MRRGRSRHDDDDLSTTITGNQFATVPYRVQLKLFAYTYSFVCRPASRRSDLCSSTVHSNLQQTFLVYARVFRPDMIRVVIRHLSMPIITLMLAYVPTSTSKIHIISRNMNLFTVTYRLGTFYIRIICLHWVFVAVSGFRGFR